MRLRFAVASLLALGIACSGDDESPAPTPTLFPELAASPGPTFVPPPVPTQLPPLDDFASTIWLVEAASGNVITLYEDHERPAPFIAFDNDPPSAIHGVFEDGAFYMVRVDLAGAELEREGGNDINSLLWPAPWRSTDEGCEVDGRLYADTNCGPLSPNGRWMIYSTNRRALEGSGEEYDLLVLDLNSGETHLLFDGLFQCTQCDAGPPFSWSASGNYFFTGDAGRDNRILVFDLAAGTNRDVTTSLAKVVTRPVWSPAADILLRPSKDGRSLLDDVASGSSTVLKELGWPARFDPSGRYAYATGVNTTTAIVDIETTQLVSELAGNGRYDPAMQDRMHLVTPGEIVAARGDGLVAALAGAPGCEGTTVYSVSGATSCVEGGGAAQVSPDGAYIVLFRKTGETGTVDAPWIQAMGFNIYDVVLFDTESETQRVVAEGALGTEVPYLIWNQEGTHVLAAWPYQYGP